MNRQIVTPPPESWTWAARLSAAASAVATVALAPTAGKAAIVTVTNRPVSLTTTATGAQALWDVDGTGDNEFRLWNTQGIVNLGSFPSSLFRGYGFVGPTASSENLKALAASYNVGTGNIWGFAYRDNRSVMQGNGTLGPDLTDFSAGDNYFGFRFKKDGSLHYGFGVLNLDSANKIVTISRWAYDDVADTPIHVEPISEAAVPAPIGLAGLAAGAAWTRKLRRRIRETE